MLRGLTGRRDLKKVDVGRRKNEQVKKMVPCYGSFSEFVWVWTDLWFQKTKVRTDPLVFLSPEQPSLPCKFIKFVFYRILCSAILFTWRLDGAQLKLYKLRCTAGTAGSTSWHAHFSQPGPELTEKSCASGFQRPGAGLLISTIPGNWSSWHQRWVQIGV